MKFKLKSIGSIYYLLSFLLFMVFLVSCSSDDDNNDSVPNSTFNKVITLDTVSVDIIKQIYTTVLTERGISSGEIDSLLSKLKYDIIINKVEYKATDPFGVEKIISGLFAYPILPEIEKSKSLSVVSIQHGTLTYPTQAPSNVNKNNLVARDGLGLISAAHEKGYISVQPDYFGYGTDENNVHYYEVSESLADATRKLIETTPKLAKEKNLNLNYDNLYLMGYSEGGNATISTLMSFSAKPGLFKNYITISGSGAYDKKKTFEYVFLETAEHSSKFSASYAWAGLIYSQYYKMTKTIEELYSPEVVPEISKYIGNNQIMTSQNFPAIAANLYHPNFVKEVLGGTEKEFLEILRKNDISDFDAKGSVSLIYGTDDIWVPAFNTLALAENLTKRGTEPSVTKVEGGTHASTYAYFFYIAASKF